MSRVALLAFALALLLAGCGGGNEQEKPPYTVDLSSPEGAANAWKYAIEWQDEEVLAQVALLSERDTELLRFRDNVRSAKARKISTKVALDEKGQLIDENTTLTWVIYTLSEQGKEDTSTRHPLVIVKDTDGMWRYSAAETKKANDEIKAGLQAQREAQENLPQESPPGNAPQPPANGE